MKIGIFYGSNGGNTEEVAKKVQSRFDADLINISKMDKNKIQSYDFIIFASSTWGAGDLCDDWEMCIDKLEGVNLENKYISFIGLGDQYTYSDTFCDAPMLIYEKLPQEKVKLIGLWPLDGYEYEESRSIVNDKFLGLMIDEDNQPEMTDFRIEKWVSQLKSELEL